MKHRLSSLPDPGAVALDGYTRPTTLHDEVLEPDGTPRAHWQTFLRGMNALGLCGLERRWREARHLLHREGITHNVYGDPQGRERAWPLDPFPLLISAEESAALKDGLVQRARLLEAILADLYGAQDLLAEGLLPPELLFANPAFLRPCHGITWPAGRRLHLVAFDLGRTDGGVPCVLADRTQAPSGAGYCLENRLALARLLPELFRACNVQRLAPFFRALRDGLHALAPHGANPTTVLLTPGRFNETYFEHNFLARYLGLPLVEGRDLTVRDGRVFLKLLDGLEPVDVIWRRLDDDYCDPLELRGDSFLGVPGLVEAARAGNVAIANALGCGLVESPAFIPFLPRLCRHLLGEPLLHPSVPTFWCGEPDGLAHVLANLPNLAVKAAFRPVRRRTLFGSHLTRHEQQELAERIRARPWEYVGQEVLSLSTAPVLDGATPQPRRVVVRAYLTAAPDGYVLMPGGLTRVAPAADSPLVLMQEGAGSKDTWVLGSAPVAAFSLLAPTGQPVALSRGGSDLPSRVADDLFWLGRYVERADGMVRLLRAILVRLTERTGLADAPEIPCLLAILARGSPSNSGFIIPAVEPRQVAPDAELRALVFDTARPGSLAFNVHEVYRTGSALRDRISIDMWRAVSRLYEAIGPPAEPFTLSDLLERLDEDVLTLAAFAGLAAESMTRGHGWRFLEVGRRLERTIQTFRLVHMALAAPTGNPSPRLEASLLEALLEIADSAIIFRRRYLAGPQVGPVLDLLLADEANPRSAHAQLLALRLLVDELPRIDARTGASPIQRTVLFLLNAVQLAEVESLVELDPAGHRPRLDDFLAGLERQLPLLAEAITHYYLSHQQPARHFAQAAINAPIAHTSTRRP